jgi:hypothetical protein
VIYAPPGSSQEIVTSGFATGLAGTIGYRVRDNQGNDSIARTTTGIVEDIAGSGIYRATITAPATAGQYTIVWDSGSGVYATEELVVTYTTPTGSTGPLYITRAQLKSTQTMGTTYADADVDAAIIAACRAIENTCQRRFYADNDANQIRYYTPDDRWLLEIDDIATFTSLETDPAGDGSFTDTWASGTDFDLEPLNAQADTQNVKPYTRVRVRPNGAFAFDTLRTARSVKVTAQFGWPTVPSEIVEATTLLASQLLTVARSAPMGIVAFDGGAIRVARTNGPVMMLIGPLMRHRIAVG